jgi:hypothetical protein
VLRGGRGWLLDIRSWASSASVPTSVLNAADIDKLSCYFGKRDPPSSAGPSVADSLTVWVIGERTGYREVMVMESTRPGRKGLWVIAAIVVVVIAILILAIVFGGGGSGAGSDGGGY